MAVPVLFLFHASSKPTAMLPIRLKIPWKICRIFISTNVPVPFVQTSKKLFPILLTSPSMPFNAFFIALMVFCPSAAHASLNGWNIRDKTSLNFFTQGIVEESKTAASIEGCAKPGADDSTPSVSAPSDCVSSFSILSNPAKVLLNFSAAFVAAFVEDP